MSSDEVQFQDFSDSRKPVRFKVQGELYQAYEALSVDTLQRVVTFAKQVGDLSDDVIPALSGFYRLVMDEENATRLINQFVSQAEEPATADQAVAVMNWLLEVYGLRPSVSSSDSSVGSATDGAGTPSTAGA